MLRFNFHETLEYLVIINQIRNISINRGSTEMNTGQDILTEEELLAKIAKVEEFNDKTLNMFGSIQIPTSDIVKWTYGLLTVDDIVKEPNVEVRRVMLLFYGLENFIRDGGGQMVMNPQKLTGDYSYAAVYKFNFDGQDTYFLMLINRTIEPGAEDLTPDERLKRGLTPDGYKKYVIGCKKPEPEDTLYDMVGYTWRLPRGTYRPDVEA